MLSELTAPELRRLLDYNPENGVFIWKHGSRRRAGYKSKIGYWKITVSGSVYFAHRLAWLYVNGQWPKAETDHINGVKDDNRIANLREADHGQNQANSIRSNTTGFKGVQRRGRRFRAQLKKNRTWRALGTFDTPEEAHSAYVKAAAIEHGEFLKV